MKTAIGLPIINGVPAECVKSIIMAIVECSKISEIELITTMDLFPHDRARALITGMAIDAGCDKLFWIDADMVLPSNAFNRMLEAMDGLGAQVVSGHYYMRGEPYQSVWTQIIQENGEQKMIRPVMPGLDIYEISSSGLGCALVDLNWLKANVKPPYYTGLVGETCSIVYDDVSFYTKIRESGGRILGHGRVRCGHLGTRTMVFDQMILERLKAEELKRQKPATAEKAVGVDNGCRSEHQLPEVQHAVAGLSDPLAEESSRSGSISKDQDLLQGRSAGEQHSG